MLGNSLVVFIKMLMIVTIEMKTADLRQGIISEIDSAVSDFLGYRHRNKRIYTERRILIKWELLVQNSKQNIILSSRVAYI